MSSTRIYVVKRTGTESGDTRLIEATSQAAAIRHAIGGTLTAEAATPKELAMLMRNGIELENAVSEVRTASIPEGQ